MSPIPCLPSDQLVTASPGKRYSRQRGGLDRAVQQGRPSPAPRASEFYWIAPRGEAVAPCRRAKQHVFRRIVSFMPRPRDFVLEPLGRQHIARQRAHELPTGESGIMPPSQRRRFLKLQDCGDLSAPMVEASAAQGSADLWGGCASRNWRAVSLRDLGPLFFPASGRSISMAKMN